MHTSRSLAALLIAASGIAFAFEACAQTLYKWVDQDGRTHFSDKPPAGFKGEVTKIQADAVPDVVIRAPAAPAKAQAQDDDKEKAPPDVAARRRQLRDQLAARVAVARANVEAARKALGDGEGATDDEKQYVRQESPRDERRPERTPPPRSNCMSQKTSDGKSVWNCPRPIPGEAYFERQAKLEEALRKAEEELADAERAYRRGVD